MSEIPADKVLDEQLEHLDSEGDRAGDPTAPDEVSA